MRIWSRLYSCLQAYCCFNDDRLEKADLSDQDLLKQAHMELDCAYNMLSRVVDEEMVDCAIFSINAAEKRYNYLIKKIKIQHKAELRSGQETTVVSQL